MNPASIVNDWFMKQPVEHRHTVAFFTLTLLPGYPIDKAMDSDNLIDHFTEWLLDEDDQKHHSVGRVLFVKAVIALNLACRATEATWDETGAFFERVKISAAIDGYPGVVKDSAHEQEKIALRKRQWKKTLAEWDALCNGQLSNVNLSNTLAP